MPNSQFEQSANRNPHLQEEWEILKLAPTKDYLDILFLCSMICKMPAVVLLVKSDREYLVKTAHGIAPEKVAIIPAFFDRVLNERKLVQTNDLDREELENLEYGSFSFCAALPLLTESGGELGILLILGQQEKQLDQNQRKSLDILREQILNLVAYRKQNNEILRVQHKLEEKYGELERFAGVVSHDLKSPLANIISLTQLLKEENHDDFNETGKQYLDYLSQSSESLRSYIDGLLTFYRSEKILEKEEEDVQLREFFEEITRLYSVKPDVEINYPRRGRLEKVNKAALTQIFMNLISNALKYNNKDQRRVDILFEPTDTHYQFEVRDNGNGIPKESFLKIFQLFTTLDINDRDGNPGNGIGLATVKKLLDHMNGSIQIESEPGVGSNFKLKIRRLS